MKNIGIACDHAGYEYKERLVVYLKDRGFHIHDFGTFSNESMDYPDTAHPLAEAISKGELPMGISLCGTANGIAIAANRHKDVRSAICWNTEIAKLARQHNDANICSLPARFISFEETIDIVNAFLATDFEGGRHENRIKKINI